MNDGKRIEGKWEGAGSSEKYETRLMGNFDVKIRIPGFQLLMLPAFLTIRINIYFCII